MARTAKVFPSHVRMAAKQQLLHLDHRLLSVSPVLDFAAVMELVPKDRKNPAQWRGGFQHLWPRPPAKAHYRALPYGDAPPLFATLIERDTTPAYALAFLMLCGSRTEEVLGAPWSEVDLKTSLWGIPGSRMKMSHPHTVPLTKPALDILAVMRQRRPSSNYLFPAEHGGKMGGRALEGLIHRALGEGRRRRGRGRNGPTIVSRRTRRSARL